MGLAKKPSTRRTKGLVRTVVDQAQQPNAAQEIKNAHRRVGPRRSISGDFRDTGGTPVRRGRGWNRPDRRRVLSKCGTATVRAGTTLPLAPLEDGKPNRGAPGEVDGFLYPTESRATILADGGRMAGQVSLRIGSMFLEAPSSITLSPTGEAGQAGGVIRSCSKR